MGVTSELNRWTLEAQTHSLFGLALFSLQICFKLAFPTPASLGSGARLGRFEKEQLSL